MRLLAKCKNCDHEIRVELNTRTESFDRLCPRCGARGLQLKPVVEVGSIVNVPRTKSTGCSAESSLLLQVVVDENLKFLHVTRHAPDTFGGEYYLGTRPVHAPDNERFRLWDLLKK